MQLLTFVFPFLLAAWMSIQHDAPFEEDLVAYYSFNDCDVRDDSGGGSDGTMFGDPACWCGVEDDGLLLDGVNDYFELHGPVNKFFTTSDFTISFYFKASGMQPLRQSLLSKSEACEPFHMLDFLLIPGKNEVDIQLHETDIKFYPGLSTKLDSSRWNQIAIVREGTRAFTYVNGHLRSKGFRCSGVDLTNGAVLSFSNSPCVAEGKARRFRGIIDELRVYKRALSEDEVLQLYNLFPVETALIDCVS